MTAPLLVTYFDRLPPLNPGDDEELWAAGAGPLVNHFKDEVRSKYTEGTLARLLAAADVRTRRAAALAVGLLGTMGCNQPLAARLRDDDPLVQRLASDALWEVWFRGGTEDENRALQLAVREKEPAARKAALDDLITLAPDFAEARNQRAIWFFKQGQYPKAVADCEVVLRLNPVHFGAAAGLGQCYLKLKKPRAALRAFRQALDINPTLEHLHETIQALKEALDSE
ncbi:tetratricopeptide repeat protein [Urbifossiella limnaea]|uniref:Tetratricopeptide repeat protein n=1 Tax=Urbifossiella limnaea TaxID=2528023 RepID=A0A517XXU1_9BACT|nr:tetratricopeptide repeat protein [Urbifossiella limnaea]QDU22304.1 Tetratricopeptide repeat protein [Urbifossiella limnaea]